MVRLSCSSVLDLCHWVMGNLNNGVKKFITTCLLYSHHVSSSYRASKVIYRRDLRLEYISINDFSAFLLFTKRKTGTLVHEFVTPEAECLQLSHDHKLSTSDLSAPKFGVPSPVTGSHPGVAFHDANGMMLPPGTGSPVWPLMPLQPTEPPPVISVRAW